MTDWTGMMRSIGRTETNLGQISAPNRNQVMHCAQFFLGLLNGGLKKGATKSGIIDQRMNQVVGAGWWNSGRHSHSRKLANTTLLTRTDVIHLLRKYGIHNARARWNPDRDTFDGRSSCQARLKALEETKKIFLVIACSRLWVWDVNE